MDKITFIVNVFKYIVLTNYMTYGTRRFNAASTRAVQ